MDRNVFIDFSAKDFNFYNNEIFKNVVNDYLVKNPEVIVSDCIYGDNIAKVYSEVLANNLTNVKDCKAMYSLIEAIYDHWRNFQRYLIADLHESYSINENNYIAVFKSFNDFVLNAYRTICANLLGKKFTIMRELPAGGNAFVLLNRSIFNKYASLKDVRFISNIVFRPPFVVYS